MVKREVSQEQFENIHARFHEVSDTVLESKKDIEYIKKIVDNMQETLEQFETKLFKGNGQKSILERLEAVETKMLLLWSGVGAVTCLIIETVFSWFSR